MYNKYSINTTQNVSIDFEIAGIGDRLIALLMDYLILSGLLIGISLAASLFPSGSSGMFIFWAILSFMTFLFHFFMEWLMRGQTFGKKYRNIKVVHQNGREANVFNYLIRNLIRPVDMFYGLGLLVVFFNKKSQRIGDMAAGTLVVKIEKESSEAKNVIANVEENYQPAFDKINVLRLDQEDINLIKEVINRPTMKMNWELVKLTAEKMKKKTEIYPRDIKNVTFLKTLIKDYNYHNIN
jgi:uncharacterized RDD family membrane protein YckC